MKPLPIAVVAVLAFNCAYRLQFDTAGAQQAKIPPSLAKANLADAAAAAKKWKSDAFLIQVQARLTGDAGTALAWQYGFYSPGTKSCAVIFARAGQTHVSDGGGEECKASELKNFMDSDQALKLARSNGVTASEVTMVAHTDSTPQGERAIWTVMDAGGIKSGNVTLDIDAQTGAVLNKTTQP